MAQEYILAQFVQQNLQIPVFALRTGNNPAYPLIVYSKRSGEGNISMTGPSYRFEVYTFSSKAKTISEARFIATQVFELLHNFSESIFAVNGSEIEDYDESDEVYSVDQDFSVIIGAEIPFYNFARIEGVGGTIGELAIFSDKFVISGSSAITIDDGNVNITSLSSSLIQANNIISNSVTASNVLIDDLIVVNNITVGGVVGGTAATASYVEFTGVANKPTLFSGSAQVDFDGISNKPTLVSSSAQIDFNNIQNQPVLIDSASIALTLQPGIDVVVNKLTAEEIDVNILNVNIVSSSVIYSSGSNKFGDDLSNTHQFTGSVEITGSLTVIGELIGAASSASYVDFDNVDNKPTLVSSSAQIDFNNIQNQPVLIESASLALSVQENINVKLNEVDAKIIKLDGTGALTGSVVISGSLEVIGVLTGAASSASYVDFSDVDNKPTLFSASAQVDFDNISNKPNLISGSSQIDFDNISNKPTLVSGSLQIDFAGISNKPTLVSGSAQIDFNNIQNQPTFIPTASLATSSSFAVSSSFAQSATSSSFAVTASFTQSSISASFAVTASFAESAVAFIPDNLEVETVTASFGIITNEFSASDAFISSIIFGNEMDDVHQFTGSVFITGSVVIDGGITGIITSASYAEFAQTAQTLIGSVETASYVEFDNIDNKPTLISASAQIDFNNIQNQPTLIDSASYVNFTNIDNKPTLISGSQQVDFDNISNKPTLISGSAQVDFDNISNKPTLVSGSEQIDFNNIQNQPTLIESASYVNFANIDNKPTLISGSAQVDFNNIQNQPTTIETSSIALTIASGVDINANKIVASEIEVDVLIVNVISSSVVYSSGSNIFGDDVIDVQQFTGSVEISGSLTVVGNIQGTISASYVDFDDVDNKPTLFSGSAQVDFNNIQNQPTTIDSASYVDFDNVDNKPTLLSSSLQVDFTDIQNKPTTIATASFVEFANIANKPSLVSGSSQIDFDNISNKPTLLSSSLQVDYTDIQNKPTLIESSSFSEFAVTASFALNGGGGGTIDLNDIWVYGGI